MALRIGIDARMIGPVMTGLGRYALGLVEHLPALDRDNRYIVIRRAGGREALERVRPAVPFEEAEVEGDLDQPVNLLAARAINRLDLDLYHSLYDFVPPGLRVRRVVLTLHDLVWLEQPDLCFDEHFAWVKARVTNLYARATMPYAAARASQVIAVSAHTKARAIEVLGLDAARVHVVHHGVDRAVFPPAGEAASESCADGPFFLCLGNTKPYKNTRAAIAALAHLVREGRDCRLLVTGRGDSRSNLARVARDLGVADRVAFTGPVTHAELLGLLHSAVCLVFPSIVEGFGLPLVEAMSAGCPVVASSAPTLAEICGDAALLPDPASPATIADAMRQMLTDGPTRARFRARGIERAARFTWESCARATLAVHRLALEDR